VALTFEARASVVGHGQFFVGKAVAIIGEHDDSEHLALAGSVVWFGFCFFKIHLYASQYNRIKPNKPTLTHLHNKQRPLF